MKFLPAVPEYCPFISAAAVNSPLLSPQIRTVFYHLTSGLVIFVPYAMINTKLQDLSCSKPETTLTNDDKERGILN